MSAILGIVSRAPAAARERIAHSVLSLMRDGRSATTRLASQGDATLTVAAHGWESFGCGESEPAIASAGSAIVVADASLYYRDALVRALAARGERPAASTPAQLILAAYRVWGDDCARHLEGDFAFILWDGVPRRIIAARDTGATRPLFYAKAGDSFVVASTIGAILAAGADHGLDLGHLGEIASGLAFDEATTCRRAVRRIPSAHTLVHTGHGDPRISRHWLPPRFESERSVSFADGAFALRDLLSEAVRERLDSAGPTSVWLSGGYDSPAVFGAGMHATGGDVDRLRPVSISYPKDDPGREDELIESITQRWNAPPRWINSRTIVLMNEFRAGAAAREEPFAHVFEHWNRALAKGTRGVGARVALHGNGGDQLFQVSLIYLADLLRRGRLLSLVREARARGVRDVRTLFRWAIQPLLPAPALRVATALRGGRRLRGYLERLVPPWIDAGFARQHNTCDRARHVFQRQRGESHAALEARWYMTSAYFPRVYGCVSALAREEGVELRAPLMDPRVIAFAAGRPRDERAAGVETKRVLRAAMRGILPDEVLAPRRIRTGTTGRLFQSALRDAGPELIADATSRSRLAELGIVDPRALERAWKEWQVTRDGNLGVPLFLTLQTEFWTRAHEYATTEGNHSVASRSVQALAGVGA